MGGRELASDQIFKKRVGRDRISVFEGGLLGKRRVFCFRGDLMHAMTCPKLFSATLCFMLIILV